MLQFSSSVSLLFTALCNQLGFHVLWPHLFRRNCLNNAFGLVKVPWRSYVISQSVVLDVFDSKYLHYLWKYRHYNIFHSHFSRSYQGTERIVSHLLNEKGATVSMQKYLKITVQLSGACWQEPSKFSNNWLWLTSLWVGVGAHPTIKLQVIAHIWYCTPIQIRNPWSENGPDNSRQCWP